MLKRIKEHFRELIQSNSDSPGLALGFGIGFFIGFLPIYGFQTIAAILAAYIVRKANKLAVIFASQIFIPPIMAVALTIDYAAGSLVLYGDFTFHRIKDFAEILLYVKPIIIGSLIAGPLAGVLAGFIFYFILKMVRKRKATD